MLPSNMFAAGLSKYLFFNKCGFLTMQVAEVCVSALVIPESSEKIVEVLKIFQYTFLQNQYQKCECNVVLQVVFLQGQNHTL